MIIHPILPIWAMAILCILLLCLKRRGLFPFLRQLFLVVLLFVANLRILIPNDSVATETQTLHANVLFVVDDTISMVANDHNGTNTRLEGAKEDCKHIIEQLNGAKFSTMIFHNKALLLGPYTKDTDFCYNTLNTITPLVEMYAKGSSMNVCKDLLLEQLKKTKENSEDPVFVFFLSDGEITNEDTLESFSAAASYLDGGAVLGYGTQKGATMTHYEYLSDTEPTEIKDPDDYFSPAVSRIDEANLKQLAKDMKLDYIHMPNTSSLDTCLQTLKQNVSTSNDEDFETGYDETYYYFAIPILLLFAVEWYCQKGGLRL